MVPNSIFNQNSGDAEEERITKAKATENKNIMLSKENLEYVNTRINREQEAR